MKSESHLLTDVLIIGGGAAAAMAAIEAAKFGVKVVLVDKGRLGRSGNSPPSGGAIWPPIPPERGGNPQTTPDRMFKDIVVGGSYLANQDWARLYVEEGFHRVVELENFGVPFTKNPDGTFLRGTPEAVGQGFGLMEALRKEVFHREVQVIEQAMVTRLVTMDNSVVGAVALDVKNDDAIVFHAAAVVLGGGSATALYPHASSAYLTTGDAYAMAYHAGATLINMEFPEFTIVPAPGGRPIATGGSRWPIAEGGHFLNGRGERFMEKYEPQLLEKAFLQARGRFIIPMYREMVAGNGPIYLDPSPISLRQWEEREKVEGEIFLIGKLKASGIDYRTQKHEWAIAIHTFMGGALINERAETTPPGLYACGEAAGHGGVLGADRGYSGLVTALVSGQRAGKCAARRALSPSHLAWPQEAVATEMARWQDLTKERGGRKPSVLLRDIQTTAWNHLGLIRSRDSLEKAAMEFQRLGQEKTASATDSVAQRLEVENLALSGEIMARAALLRRESRGEHFREDYPHQDDAHWLTWVTVRKEGAEMVVDTAPIPWERYPLRPQKVTAT
ncbi:MAG: FAD-binding protein [Chloroflexi bacterium]|nr:FAD-binding protein [Chloroflexota bacterium]